MSAQISGYVSGYLLILTYISETTQDRHGYGRTQTGNHMLAPVGPTANTVVYLSQAWKRTLIFWRRKTFISGSLL